MDPLLPPKCLDLSETIKGDEAGRQGIGKERKAPVKREKEREREMGVVGMRLVRSASQHLWPLSVSPTD